MTDSATIYARVPLATKDAAFRYAEARGLSLTAGIQELLNRGLAAAQDEAASTTMEAHVARLEHELREAVLVGREEAARRHHVEQELDAVRQAAAVWAQRADLIIGRCPACHESVTGRDVLVQGRCSHCQTSTTALMEPKTDELNNNELMLVLGGVGLLLGLLVVGRKVS